ncbi:hypothetical protein KCM76_16275 [Zooshikella marina]|uniref:hypothetical protein n=1 Tax=Zooshikella ganghwensis TaxID=202772 RepID=UPI001BAEB337|nr:hypothetical protein [Zooshikella ganghwensis]MBU2707552.1 hypothetical protein [Zooshikella ganghwensis]
MFRQAGKIIAIKGKETYDKMSNEIDGLTNNDFDNAMSIPSQQQRWMQFPQETMESSKTPNKFEIKNPFGNGKLVIKTKKNNAVGKSKLEEPAAASDTITELNKEQNKLVAIDYKQLDDIIANTKMSEDMTDTSSSKGDQKLSEMIDKIYQNTVSFTQYFEKRKETIDRLSKDGFKGINVKKIQQKAEKYSDSIKAVSSLSEEELSSAVKKASIEYTTEKAMDYGSELIYKPWLIPEAAKKVADAAENVHTASTVSDEKIQECKDALKLLSIINIEQLTLNIAQHAAVNTALAYTGIGLLPVLNNVVGYAQLGYAVSDAVNKLDSFEKEHPGYLERLQKEIIERSNNI